MIIRRLAIILFLLNVVNVLNAQNIEYAKTVIKELCSEEMAGRGYVGKGDKNAASFISNELKALNINSFKKNYYQKLSFPINTFPGTISVNINGTALKAVNEFVVSPNCPAVKGEFPITYLPQAADTVDAIFDSIAQIDYSGTFVVAPFKKRKLTRNNPFKAAGVIVPKQSLYWWASTGFNVAKTPLILVQDSLVSDTAKSIGLIIENKFIEKYNSQNVTAFIPGYEIPDSFLVFTAHYDHLGAMGKGNIFPGANDNASGVAMLLNLARHYSKEGNKPKYTTVFIFFAGEETGLHGSRHFANNPLFDLEKVKALINLDMVGSGSEGIALVNGKENKAISDRIQGINNQNNYFPNILIRGESCNSDHCFFHKAGIPAVFIYTRGKEHKAYHVLEDTPETLPLTKYSELFKLLVEFAQ